MLVTLSDKKIGVSANGTNIDYYNVDVVTANDYYPGGMTMPGRKYSVSNSYRYGFNGKEDDREIEGQQDYGMRIYDKRLVRFKSVDPLYKSYPWNSTYSFAEGDLIRSIDLDGKEKLIYTFTKADGLWTKTQIELPKAGPLGDGVLVKFKNENTEAYYYGSLFAEGTTGQQFTMKYEVGKLNSKGEHIAEQLPGEDFPTIGYGHTGRTPEEKKKYAVGTTISDAEAVVLFKKDYSKRSVTGLDQQMNDAVSDFSFNTTDDSKKTVNLFNSQKVKANFFLDRIRARTPAVVIGLAKRRAAQQILFTFKKYTFIDYSRSSQKKWQEVYDQNVTDKGELKQPEKKR